MVNDSVNESIIKTEEGKELKLSEATTRLKSDIDIYKWRLESTDANPRGIIFIAHGYGEHSRCYDDFARLLCLELNVVIASHDHVGHGRSKGNRVFIDTFDIFVDDIFCHVDEVKTLYPDLPVYLFGQSMGGALSILAACGRPDYFKAVVLCAPAIVIDPSIQPGAVTVFLGKLANVIMPQLQILPALDPKEISSDLDQIETYRSDPLVWHGGIKVRFGLKFMEALGKIQNLIPGIKWPFLVLHGDQDKITYIGGSELLVKEAKSSDKELKIYKGLKHSLIREVKEEADKVFKDIIEWLRERMAT